MSPSVNRRPYHSPLRSEQAEATRARILDAALAVFAEAGYAAGSVRTIAAAAGVSVQTLYQSWGSKPAVVEALLARVKDQIDLPGLFGAMAGGDREPHHLLRQSALISRRYSEVGWPVLELVRQVAPAEPAIAAVWNDAESRRYRGQADLVSWVADGGALRPGLSRREAADTLWTLSSHDTYRHYVAERSNSPRRFETWLYRTTAALLLA